MPVGRSLLSVEFTAYGECLALGRWLELVQEGKIGQLGHLPLPAETPAMHEGGSRRGVRALSMRVLNATTTMRSANYSHLKIQQPRKPNTSDRRLLIYFVSTAVSFAASSSKSLSPFMSELSSRAYHRLLI